MNGTQQTDLSDLEPITYSSNTLNQYTSIARPDALNITGIAPLLHNERTRQPIALTMPSYSKS